VEDQNSAKAGRSIPGHQRTVARADPSLPRLFFLGADLSLPPALIKMGRSPRLGRFVSRFLSSRRAQVAAHRTQPFTIRPSTGVHTGYSRTACYVPCVMSVGWAWVEHPTGPLFPPKKTHPLFRCRTSIFHIIRECEWRRHRYLLLLHLACIPRVAKVYTVARCNRS
jgi:hypothetical protein